MLNLAIHKSSTKPKLFINASTATIYKAAQKQLMTEAQGIIGDDFSMNVAMDWEASFFEAKHNGVK